MFGTLQELDIYSDLERFSQVCVELSRVSVSAVNMFRLTQPGGRAGLAVAAVG